MQNQIPLVAFKYYFAARINNLRYKFQTDFICVRGVLMNLFAVYYLIQSPLSVARVQLLQVNYMLSVIYIPMLQ